MSSNTSNEKAEEATEKCLTRCNSLSYLTSILSLQIANYENSTEAAASDSFDGNNIKSQIYKKSCLNKQLFTGSLLMIQNIFEVPRQQESDEARTPEVSQYRASQRLLNPNEAVEIVESAESEGAALEETPKKKRKTKNELSDIRLKWISGQIKEVKREGRNPNLIKLSEDGIHVATACKVCKQVFTLDIGTSQRNHGCTNPLSILYSTEVFDGFKKAFTTMSIRDFTSFNTVEHPGFQEAILFAMQLGTQLPPEAKELLNHELISSLLPSAQTISRSVQKKVVEIQHFYAYLQKVAESTKFTLAVDSTTSSYHYTSYNISFIDEKWKFRSYVLDIHCDEIRSEQDAAGARLRTDKILESCGLTKASIYCVVTDEASTMDAAFGNHRYGDDIEHSVCGCHLCSTVCKRAFDPYVTVTREYPLLCRQLKPIQDILKDAQSVATAIKSRVFLKNSLSHKVGLRCETRWLSVVPALKSLIGLKTEDIELVEIELANSAFMPHWARVKSNKELLQRIIDVCKPLQEAVLSFEGNSKPTLYLVLPLMKEIITKMTDIEGGSDNDAIKALAKIVKMNINEKFIHFSYTHIFSTLLHPNYKNNVQEWIPTGYTKADIVAKLIERVTKFHEPLVGIEALPDETTESSTWAELFDNSVSPQTLESEVRKEIADYLKSKTNPSLKLLEYWKYSSFKYLAAFARVIHGIPASSSAPEQTFSVMQRVDTDYRPNLSAEQITNLVKLHCIEKFFDEQND